jgi:hypothetical protein
MPIDRQMLPQIHSSMLAAKARIIFDKERTKGCLPEISSTPVELEPPFQALVDPEDLLYVAEQPPFIPTTPPSEEDWIRLKIWVPPGQECDWLRNELVVKQFVALKHRITFEITGNRDGISLAHLCHKEDEPVVRAATCGFFPDCEFSVCHEHPLDVLPESAWQRAVFDDFYTPPPYSHLLTRPTELKLSPLESLVNGLSILIPPSVGVYQVVVQPTAHNHAWSCNVELLIDLEYLMKLHSGHPVQQRFTQQAPSGQLNNMASDVETKSHPDKPFFCAAVRVGLLGNTNGSPSNTLRALTPFMNLFQHGKRPLETLTQDDYLRHVSSRQTRDMFRLGVTYRAGALLNSAEVSGLLHIPPMQVLIHRGVDISVANSLPARGAALRGGTCIGIATSAEGCTKVCIPDELRCSHVYIPGKPGTGKTSEMIYACGEDIAHGHGIAIIDPHDDLCAGVLKRITESDLDRVIYFDPGHPTFVPLWNFLAPQSGQPADRQADDRLRAFTQVTTGWGHRIETLMRQAFYGLIQTGEGTLLDVALLLSTESAERERIRLRVLEVVENEKARHFWEHELKTYRKDDFAPVQHKLSKLLLYDTPALMFSQLESRFDFREMMDSGKIFIANLANVGSEARDILGSLLLSVFHLAALSRSDIPAQARKPFHVYVDEAHRFVTPALEDMLAETRKYNCSITLAHQYLSQFQEAKRVDALGVVGTTIAFNVAATDAPRIAKFLGGQVSAEDLTTLAPREAIARIGNDVVRIKTPSLTEIRDTSMSARAKALSYERYYKPIHEVRDAVRKRIKTSTKCLPARPSRSRGGIAIKEFQYDEFPS